MRKMLSIVIVFTAMVSLFVFPSFAADGVVAEDPTDVQDSSTEGLVSDAPVIEDLTPEITAHGPRSERMKDLLADYESGLWRGDRITMADSIQVIFSDVLPGWASVAVWIGDRIQPDLFVYLCAMVVIYSIVGGYRHVNRD